MAEAITFFAGMVLTASLIAAMRWSRLAQSVLDQPNHRSLHEVPKPRIGGLAIAVSTAAVLALLHPAALADPLLLPAVVLVGISLLDDRAHLPASFRLLVHLAAALCALYLWHSQGERGPGQPPGSASWAAAVLAVLAIGWMTNLFNFMDGADGLAGGMTLIGFGAYAAAYVHAPIHEVATAALPLAIAGSAAGFLLFNFPPASVFLGDAGSVPLGFLAAVLGMQGALVHAWPWWFGLLVFSPFIVDATLTLLKRLARGQKIWIAHREHYYQRLILSGWSHRRTAFAYYIVMLGSALSALAAQNGEHLFPIASFWVITYLSLLLYLEWRFYIQEKDKKKSEAK